MQKDPGEVEVMNPARTREVLSKLAKISANNQKVDEDELAALTAINPRFMDKKQLDRIWCIAQRNQMIVGSEDI